MSSGMNFERQNHTRFNTTKMFRFLGRLRLRHSRAGQMLQTKVKSESSSYSSSAGVPRFAAGQRPEFPRMKVSGLPRKWKKGEIKNYLVRKGVEFRNVKRNPRKPEVFVSFDSQAKLDTGVGLVSGDSYKNGLGEDRHISACQVATAAEQNEQNRENFASRRRGGKRKRGGGQDGGDASDSAAKRQAQEQVRLQPIGAEALAAVRDRTEKYWRKPYEQQLVRKQNDMRKVLIRVATSLVKAWKDSCADARGNRPPTDQQKEMRRSGTKESMRRLKELQSKHFQLPLYLERSANWVKYTAKDNKQREVKDADQRATTGASETHHKSNIKTEALGKVAVTHDAAAGGTAGGSAAGGDGNAATDATTMPSFTEAELKTIRRKKKGVFYEGEEDDELAYLTKRALRQCCPFEGIVASPVQRGYRNKCDCTIGTFGIKEEDNTTVCKSDTAPKASSSDSSEAGKTSKTVQAQQDFVRVPSVGFKLGSFDGGPPTVVFPFRCQNIPLRAKKLMLAFQQFVRESRFTGYEASTHSGFWRQLIVKHGSKTGDLMAVVVVNHPSTNVTDAECKEEIERWASMMSDADKVAEYVRRGMAQAALDYSTDVAALEKDFDAVDHKYAEERCAATSLFAQKYDGLSNPDENDPMEHVQGERTLSERMYGGLQFKVSPAAFFQVNTVGAERLFALVNEYCDLGEMMPVTILDVCCGTGTIGIAIAAHRKGEIDMGISRKVLSLASSSSSSSFSYSLPAASSASASVPFPSKSAASVGSIGSVRKTSIIGIELCKEAVEDAKVNAELNGIENISFVAKKAEDCLPQMLGTEKADSSLPTIPTEGRVVAIVDPPRSGLHKDVLAALRSNERIERIVYVSCNPEGSLRNDLLRLCGPITKNKRSAGTPFMPVRAAAVDMFPMTPHTELVLQLDRLR